VSSRAGTSVRELSRGTEQLVCALPDFICDGVEKS